MATGILGLGTGQAASLNQDLLDKLKAAEKTAVVDPYDTKIENITSERETFTSINDKIAEMLTAVKPFDLFVSGGQTAFDSKYASTSGTSVSFDASDMSALNKGITTVDIKSLAQRDVYQSDVITDITSALTGLGDLTINGSTFTTEGKTYEQLVEEIDLKSGMSASLQQVGTSSYRLVVKSEDPGIDNGLSISGDFATNLNLNKDSYTSSSFTDSTAKPVSSSSDLVIGVNGTDYTIDIKNLSYDDIVTQINNLGADVSASIVDNALVLRNTNSSNIEVSGDASTLLGFSNSGNHMLSAKDMNAFVDGIEYTLSSNNLTVDGLQISALSTGTSSINITDDKSSMVTQMQNFVTLYNDLTTLLSDATLNEDSNISNKAAIRSIASDIKGKLFGMYGADSDKSIFNYGFSLDQYGVLTLDETKFSDALDNDYSGLKELVVGTAEKRGFGTQLKELIDGMNYSNGTLSLYETDMTDRETKLNEEKTKAEEALDTRYSLLAAQFASYAAIITQMDSSFSGLQMMIQQSVSSNG